MPQSLDFVGWPPIIGIVRQCPPPHLEAVVKSAAAAGITCLEVTLDSEDPLESITRVREAFPDLTVGVGTVLDASQVVEAAAYGAQFVVSPIVEGAIVARCRERGLPCLLGAGTVTEIWTAHRLGADAVKLFPVEQLGGPEFVRALRSPLPHVSLVPTGGVDASNARRYLEAGATALGVGSGIFPRETLETGDAEKVGALATALLKTLE